MLYLSPVTLEQQAVRQLRLYGCLQVLVTMIIKGTEAVFIPDYQSVTFPCYDFANA